MIGAVHVAAGNPVHQEVPTPIVPGVVVPIEGFDEDGEMMARRSTANLTSRFRVLEKFVVLSGLISTFAYLAICVMYVWFAWSVPTVCNVHLKEVFLGLGMINGTMGCIMACYVSVAQTMLSAMSHGARADKYRIEAREDEASSEETEYEAEARQASRCILVPSCFYVVAVNALIAFWVIGIVQASEADDELCSGMDFTFWVLLLLNFTTFCGSSRSKAASYQAPLGRLLPASQ